MINGVTLKNSSITSIDLSARNKKEAVAQVKKLWEEDVNSACAGTHDFKINMPNNVARVIDLYNNGSMNPKDLHTLDIQSNQTIVRDFNFNTVIDSKIATTVAIAAQAPK